MRLKNVSRRAVVKLYEKESKPYLLRPKKTSYSFAGSNNIKFGRGKDKKKRKVRENSPSADGQLPLHEIGQQRTGYKYYRKRRALGFLTGTAALGGVTGAAIGGMLGSVADTAKPLPKQPAFLKKGQVPVQIDTAKRTKQGLLIGAGVGALGLGGASLLEHMKSKHSPFYQKKLFGDKKK